MPDGRSLPFRINWDDARKVLRKRSYVMCRNGSWLKSLKEAAFDVLITTPSLALKAFKIYLPNKCLRILRLFLEQKTSYRPINSLQIRFPFVDDKSSPEIDFRFLFADFRISVLTLYVPKCSTTQGRFASRPTVKAEMGSACQNQRNYRDLWVVTCDRHIRDRLGKLRFVHHHCRSQFTSVALSEWKRNSFN